MLPNTISLSLQKNPISKILDSAYYPVDPNNSWKVASAYDIFDDLDIELIHPRSDATSPIARWKWMHWDDVYEVYFEFVGGRPPYRFSILSAPENVYLGASGTAKSQVFDFVQDPDVAGMYTLEMPDDFGLIRCEPTVAQRGQSLRIVVRLEDMAGRVNDYSFTPTVDTPAAPKFRYLNSAAGNNANAGTKASPLQTFPHAYNLSDSANFIHVFENGTYYISDGSGGNATVDGKPKSFIGRGSGTVLDMSVASFTGSPTDVFFDNLKFDGGRPTEANPRQCNWNGRFDRYFMQRCSASNNPIGTQTSQDNPCWVFCPDSAGWGTQSKWFGMRDCHIDSTSKTAMCILFKIENGIIRKCTGFNLNMDGHIPLGKNPVGMFINPKGKITNFEVSYCEASGFTNNSFLSWMNQNPENCTKQRTRFCKFDYTGNTMFAPIVYNSQAEAVGSRGTDQRVERCSIKAGALPVISTKGGVGGEPVKVSGIIYSTSDAFLSNPANATQVNTTSLQITAGQFDSSMNIVAALKAANLGIRGGQTASTLVS